MAAVLVSNVIHQLATIIQQETEQEVRLVLGVEKDVDKLFRTFMKIQAVLKDAEERQVKENSVRLWLQDLKDVAYDIDDVLDEWSTEINLKSQMIDHPHHGVDDDDHARISLLKKVCLANLFSPCFCFKRLCLRHDIGHRIKEIKEKLDEIAIEKDKFGFTETTPRNNEIIYIDQSRSRSLETSSFVDVSEVFGRKMDKEIMISKLTSEGSSQENVGAVYGVPLISIVAMGGMGKTTLAQLVFNDERVKNHFNKKIWVYVSKSFDKVKIAMHIITEIGGNIVTITQGGDNNITWEAVHRELTSCVDGKNFLLVLDDVWNEDPEDWDPLRISLKHGSQGSRIIVTTRNEKVANMMGSTYVHGLGVLSDEDCWSLLRHYAFVGIRQQEEGEDGRKEIGMKLANKCSGLPLSAKTLGSLLRFKKSKWDWKHVLESDVWKVVSGVDKPVLPALLLSYYDLPSNLKQCFAHCSLIPRGYPIHKENTVREWMAQGFLSYSHLASSSEDLITSGDECFNNLVMRSFFQQVDKASIRQVDKSSIGVHKMHDIVYDFGKSLVESECLTLTIKDDTTKDLNSSRVRHLYLAMEKVDTVPSFIYKAKNLRTLNIYGQIPKLSSELFHNLRCLRTLNLGSTYLEELPIEIEKLIHLRYLNLDKARFQELPKAVTSLYNLQVLSLHDCRNLCKLPEGIKGLVNLTDLNISECRQLSYLPEGIGRLSRLRRLSDFIIGGVERGGCKIGELKDLNFLNDTLTIIGLGRIENGNEAKMACLKNKQHLGALYFYFDVYYGVSRVDDTVIDDEGDNAEEEEEEPVASRVDVEIVMEEIGDTLSRRMEDVLESLQPHPNLEKLVIKDYPGAVFPKWMGSQEGHMIFSNLVFLDLSWCGKCMQLPSSIGKLPSLETLVIGGMENVKFMGVEFFGIDAGATRSDSTGADTIFPKLKVFQLLGMWILEEWDMKVKEEDGKEFIFMPCLQYLFLFYLPKLRIFPHHFNQATSLRKLMIWFCPKLSCMPSPSSHLPFLHIEELILKWDAGSFSTSLLMSDNHMFFPNLKLLRVRQSPYSLLPEGIGQLRSLEILDIRTCSKINSIPDGELQHLTALQELRIMRCSVLRRRCQKETGEDWSKISHIPKIFIDGERIK